MTKRPWQDNLIRTRKCSDCMAMAVPVFQSRESKILYMYMIQITQFPGVFCVFLTRVCGWWLVCRIRVAGIVLAQLIEFG